jgi:hypothetical protein
MTLTDLDRYGYMTIERESKSMKIYIFAMNLTDNPGQFLYRPGESDNRYSLDACLHASILAYRGCDPCR